MNSPTGKHMDITKTRSSGRPPAGGMRLSRRQTIGLIGGITLLVIAILGMQWFSHRNDLRIDTSKYQAVFLDNDQVFFGRLQNTEGVYLTLKGAYYVQGQDKSATAEEKPAGQETSTQLLKVSDTVYGPDDSMSIQSSKVLFWQNLTSDSKVAQAIDKQN